MDPLCPLTAPPAPSSPSAGSLPLTLCGLCRFPSSWRARSSLRGPQSFPKTAPLDASPCRASWGPSPPSPCTDTAQTRAVSGAAHCGHVAHPGFSALPGPLPSRPAREALAAEGRGTRRQGPSPSPRGPSPPVSPGPQWEGQGRGRAVDGGLWSPHCPGGSSWSNCLEAPGPGP